ncbi:Exosome complex component RRP43 [Tetrabaena socialis]|uniref:Ribosomal RNA-processing protein 43 n=1 Tax=Tetrabaena socialis TaxID=47790 RepID=A0A2J7ZQY9_9CHLO|nr:Exosome complex component RRP43 [Tetrabaena socialis]|eukprot:PNH02688.1 Exosome complex component RRP43 [Tetrabaena socialis]
MAEDVEADAFKKLYPEQFFDRFLSEGIRPDGRPLGRTRAVTIGAGAVTSTDGSALVKIGRTTVLAGVKLEIIRPDEAAPGAGQLALSVELAPFSSADYRPGRPTPDVSSVTEKLSSALLGGDAVQLAALCIAEGKAAWRAVLDVYVLDADGCVLDTALLACVAALRNTRVPAVRSTREGHYVPAGHGKGGDPASLVAGCPTAVTLDRAPLSLTCSLYGSHVLVDPTADEERLAECSVTVVLDQHGGLQGVYKAGGRVLADAATLVKCTEAARLRHRELSGLLEQSLAQGPPANAG